MYRTKTLTLPKKQKMALERKSLIRISPVDWPLLENDAACNRVLDGALQYAVDITEQHLRGLSSASKVKTFLKPSVMKNMGAMMEQTRPGYSKFYNGKISGLFRGAASRCSEDSGADDTAVRDQFFTEWLHYARMVANALYSGSYLPRKPPSVRVEAKKQQQRQPKVLKMLNHKTQRYVLLDGKLGRQLERQYKMNGQPVIVKSV